MFTERYHSMSRMCFSSFILTGSMDLSIAFRSSPPHASVILSAVRVPPSLQALTEIYLKCAIAFIMPQVLVKSFLCKNLCGSTWPLWLPCRDDPSQLQHINGHRHAEGDEQKKSRYQVWLSFLFSAQPSHFTLPELFSSILSRGRINTDKKQWY